MKILIVDDVRMHLKILEKFLSSHGEVDSAGGGAEAISLLKKSFKDKLFYDLICLDLMMPEVSGYEVLEKIHQLEKKYQPPEPIKVIIISSINERNKVVGVLKQGVHGYLVKPFSQEKINLELTRLQIIDEDGKPLTKNEPQDLQDNSAGEPAKEATESEKGSGKLEEFLDFIKTTKDEPAEESTLDQQ